MPVTVDVLELDGTLVESLSATRQVRDVAGKDDPTAKAGGDGTVTIDWDHPDVADLTSNRVVRVSDTRKRLEFLVDHRGEVVKPSLEEQDRVTTATGQGPLAVLKRVRTRGTMPYGSRPESERRLWGPNAPEFPRGSWGTPYVQTRSTSTPRRPWDMPSQFAAWLWTRPEPGDPGTSHPVEGAWLHTQFTVGDETDVAIAQTADDSFRQYLHGVELQDVEEPYPGDVWHWPYTAGCRLAPGTYDYVVYVHNDGGRGASITEIWETGPAGITTALRLSGFDAGSNPVFGTWRCLIQSDDDPIPGCSPGLILRTYHAEGLALDDPEGTEFTFMFSATHDSNGVAWVPQAQTEYSNEGNLYDAWESLTETAIDGWAELGDDGIEIYAVNKGTRGTADKFSVTTNQVVSHKVVDTDDIENSVLVVSEKGRRLVTHAASIAAHGSRPAKAPIRCGKITDGPAMEALGQTYLGPRAWPGRSHVIEVTPMTEFDADPGDSGTVAGVADLQVASIGFELEEGGELRKIPTFETSYQRQLRDSQRIVDRMIRDAGTVGSVRIIDSGTQIKTGRLNPVKLCSWGFDFAEDLEFIEWDLPDEPGWRRYTVEEKARLCRVVITADWAEPDGIGGHEQVTTGPTTIQVLLNSQPLSVGAWTCTIGTLEKTSHAQLWGPALIYPEQTLSIAGVEYGGHINGTVTLYASDPL